MATNIYDIIDTGRIPEAVRLLRKAAAPYPTIMERLDSVATTYRYMRDYFLDGAQDDSRERIYREILESLRVVARLVSIERRIPSDTSGYFAALRMERVHPTVLTDMVEKYMADVSRLNMEENMDGQADALRKEAEQLLDRIFIRTRILSPDSSKELSRLTDILIPHSKDHAPLVRQIVVARTLGALSFCDKASLNFLLDLYDGIPDERLSAVILTCIVLILNTWPRMERENPDLNQRLGMFMDSIVNYTRLRDVVMTLIRTRDTDRVARKMKDDLIPSLMNTSPEIMRRLSEAGGVGELSDLEENPEWQKIIRDSGIEQKMQELTEMQSEGLDVMMQAFANLKQFPFFRQDSNWFLPFDCNYSALAGFMSKGGAAFMPLLGEAAGFCDSDKYSLVFSMMQMPADRMNAVAAQFGTQMEQLKEMLGDNVMPRNRSEFCDGAISFCRDLYRFLKLSPRKEDYEDVFSSPFDFTDTPLVRQLVEEPEIISLLAEFYFKAEYYSEAEKLFNRLTLYGKADGHIMEKIGYCCQVRGDHADALSYYEKAELFTSDSNLPSLWLLRKIALCHRLLGNYSRAAEYYSRALERKPESIALRKCVATMLLEAGEVDKALSSFRGIAYEYPGDVVAARGVARAELCAGNPEKADSEMMHLSLQTELADEDHRLLGHIAWFLGQRRRAADEYAASGSDHSLIELELRRIYSHYPDSQFDTLGLAILLNAL